MAYELRIAGQSAERFDTSDEAVARARDILRENADAQVEVIDLTTGRPYAPAAGGADRDEMANKVGY